MNNGKNTERKILYQDRKKKPPLLKRLKNKYFDSAKRKDSIRLLKRSLGYFIPYKVHILVSFLAMGVTSLTGAATAFLVKPAMDDIFLQKDVSALIVIPLVYFLIVIIKAGSGLLNNYMMQFAGLKVLEKLRDELYSKIIRLPISFYENTQIGMLMSRVINDVVMIRGSLPSVITLARELLTLLALMGVVFYRDLQLALISFVVLPLAFFPFIYYGEKIRRIGRSAQKILASTSVILQETLSGIRVVKAFSTEKMESERYDLENKRLLKNSLKESMAGEISTVAMELVSAIGVGFVLFYGGMKVIEGSSTPGTFFSFVAALALMYDPIKKITSANNKIQRALAGAERVFEILDSETIVEEKGGDLVLDRHFGELRFADVSFSYGKGNALKNVNLTVRAGERLAVVGPSGAGKTTFVSMIPRFYDPTSGTISINGVNISGYTLESLRANISIVSQDNFLFDATIRENIAYGSPGFSQEQIEEAARAAYAHDFIMETHDGYGTMIGERGVKLSGGQKQRLTIARAIAKGAPLLILDEATSALDSESEKIVQKALENLMRGRTSIVIAHRLSTVLNSDRILVMDQGEVVAQGAHHELLQSSRLYAKLYEMQFGGRE